MVVGLGMAWWNYWREGVGPEWERHSRWPWEIAHGLDGVVIHDAVVMRRRIEGRFQYRAMTEDEREALIEFDAW